MSKSSNMIQKCDELEEVEKTLECILENVEESIMLLNLIKDIKPPKKYYLRHEIIKEDMSYLTYFTYGDYSSFVFGDKVQTSSRQTQFTEDEIIKLEIPVDGLTMIEVD